MNNKIVIENNIDRVYEEINALIQQKKIGVKKVVNDAMVSFLNSWCKITSVMIYSFWTKRKI